MSNTSFDLISINGTALPDVKKGELSIQRNPKFTEYEGEDGGVIVDTIEEHMIKGTVSYSGLLQSEAQSIYAAVRLVSTLELYIPMTGNTRRFQAKVLPQPMTKIIHDGRANTWTCGFEFEEIGDAPEPEEET